VVVRKCYICYNVQPARAAGGPVCKLDRPPRNTKASGMGGQKADILLQGEEDEAGYGGRGGYAQFIVNCLTIV
jgi:hypothetical protein